MCFVNTTSGEKMPAMADIKRKDVQRLTHQLVDAVTQLRQDMARQDATIQRQIAEIHQLRAALQIAAGKLSTLPPYTDWHPEVIYKALLEDGTQEARRG